MKIDGWISVNDALPIDHRDVLVYMPSLVGEQGVSPLAVCWQDMVFTGNGRYHRKWHANFTGYITHWRELPDPPA